MLANNTQFIWTSLRITNNIYNQFPKFSSIFCDCPRLFQSVQNSMTFSWLEMPSNSCRFSSLNGNPGLFRPLFVFGIVKPFSDVYFKLISHLQFFLSFRCRGWFHHLSGDALWKSLSAGAGVAVGRRGVGFGRPFVLFFHYFGWNKDLEIRDNVFIETLQLETYKEKGDVYSRVRTAGNWSTGRHYDHLLQQTFKRLAVK